MKCEICKKNKATIDFSPEPMLSLTHGWGSQHICERCLMIKNLDMAKRCVEDCIKRMETK